MDTVREVSPCFQIPRDWTIQPWSWSHLHKVPRGVPAWYLQVSWPFFVDRRHNPPRTTQWQRRDDFTKHKSPTPSVGHMVHVLSMLGHDPKFTAVSPGPQPSQPTIGAFTEPEDKTTFDPSFSPAKIPIVFHRKFPYGTMARGPQETKCQPQRGRTREGS